MLVRRYLPNGGRILDYGGGDGTLPVEALNHYTIEIYDPVQEKFTTNSIHLFDAAICSLVVPWIPDIDIAFKEIAGQLKQCAVAIVSLPNPVTFRTGRWLSLSEGKYLIDKLPPTHGTLGMIGRVVGPLRMYPRQLSEIINSMVDSGFVIVGIDDVAATTYEVEEMLKLGHPNPLQHSNISPFVTIIARYYPLYSS